MRQRQLCEMEVDQKRLQKDYSVSAAPASATSAQLMRPSATQMANSSGRSGVHIVEPFAPPTQDGSVDELQELEDMKAAVWSSARLFSRYRFDVNHSVKDDKNGVKHEFWCATLPEYEVFDELPVPAGSSSEASDI